MSVVLPHLEDRLVLGDGHHFLLIQHEVAKTESNEQPRHGGCTSFASRRYGTGRSQGQNMHRSF